ncbi:MAG: lipoyl synthase [Deltaproteobacteria bacterium]|nr:lipoyl synthase [Deltaproteobacteria bacterium]
MPRRIPDWFKVRLPSDDGDLKQVAGLLRKHRLATVCTSARCPNLAECWGSGTATIMILGRECTRHCRFCAVATSATPSPPDPDEPEQVARAVGSLGLKYAVVTSVTRDDLPDHGAGHYAAVVAAMRTHCPQTRVELLIPDLCGRADLLGIILDSRPHVVGHNLETVRRLTPLVRDPRTSYDRSLRLLALVAESGMPARTALLLGLGETDLEVRESLREAFDAGVRHVAMGQYLAPSKAHAPVDRYVTPDEFEALADFARGLGFDSVAAGPKVRSSYRAEEYAGARPPDS